MGKFPLRGKGDSEREIVERRLGRETAFEMGINKIIIKNNTGEHNPNDDAAVSKLSLK